jgi:hypothetical protein
MSVQASSMKGRERVPLRGLENAGEMQVHRRNTRATRIAVTPARPPVARWKV